MTWRDMSHGERAAFVFDVAMTVLALTAVISVIWMVWR